MRPRISPALAAVLDVVLIVVFAGIGRVSHGESLAALATTAWPFLTGGAVGWLIWFGARRHAPVSLVGGVVVWLATVAGGMLLRQAVGQGTAFSFVVVSLIANAIFLLGWRTIAAVVTRRSAVRAEPAGV